MKFPLTARLLSGALLLGACLASAQSVAAAFTCNAETFVVRRGTTLTYVDTATGAISNGSNLITAPGMGTDFNAIGQHPVTGEVFTVDIFGPSATTGRARRIDTNGQLVNVGATIPMTGLNASDYAGGTFDSAGNWLVVNGLGQSSVVDLVTGSASYGTVIATGNFGAANGYLMSGDIAYRASDDRVYFVAFSGSVTYPTFQILSVPRTAFFTGGTLTPLAGPVISGLGAFVSGASLGIDSQGNLWMSSTTLAGRPVWKFAAADLTAAGPISPVFTSAGSVQAGSGSDGFMCAVAPATLTVTKNITGPAGFPAVTGNFPFTVNCQNPTASYSSVTGDVNVPGANTGTASVSIPAGSTSCTLAETVASIPAAPAGYAWGAPAYIHPAATAAAPGAALFASIDNPLQSGSLTINKTVSGPLPRDATFNFTVTCTPPPTTPATVALGAAVTTNQSIALSQGDTTGSVTVSPIAAGSTCSVSETAPTVLALHSWGATPADVTGIAITDGVTATADFTNILSLDFVIGKTIADLSSNPVVLAAGGSFPYTMDCTNPVQTYTGTLVVPAGASGVSTTLSIPAGSRCNLPTEPLATRSPPPAGYAWVDPEVIGARSPDFGLYRVGITNRLVSGSLKIDKTVSMALPVDATFNFTLSCTAPVTTPATTALGTTVTTSQSIAMLAGATTGSVTVSPIAAGSTCSVTEAAPTAITNYKWGATPAAVTGLMITTGGTVSADVTNTLTPLDPPFITKRATLINPTTIEWTITVINNSATNAGQAPVAFTVTDPLPAGVTLVDGSVSCVPTGTAPQTSVATCGFNPGNTQLSVTGTLAYTTDTNPATASQRMDIVFRGTVANGAVVVNTAQVSLTGQAPFNVASTTQTSPSLPVPALDGKGLALLGLLLAALGIAMSRRRSGGALR